jgi:hypothetical protein
MALRAIVIGIKALFSKKPKNTSQTEDRFDKTHAEAGILSDRTSFKLYAAQNHLNYLKDIQHRHEHIIGEGRINAEMELDCYFAQIIGAKDSLLMRINEKIGLSEIPAQTHLILIMPPLKDQPLPSL